MVKSQEAAAGEWDIHAWWVSSDWAEACTLISASGFSAGRHTEPGDDDIPKQSLHYTQWRHHVAPIVSLMIHNIHISFIKIHLHFW